MPPQHKGLLQPGVGLPCKNCLSTESVQPGMCLTLALQLGPAQSSASGCSKLVSGAKCPRTHTALFGCFASEEVMLMQI